MQSCANSAIVSAPGSMLLWRNWTIVMFGSLRHSVLFPFRTANSFWMRFFRTSSTSPKEFWERMSGTTSNSFRSGRLQTDFCKPLP